VKCQSGIGYNHRVCLCRWIRSPTRLYLFWQRIPPRMVSGGREHQVHYSLGFSSSPSLTFNMVVLVCPGMGGLTIFCAHNGSTKHSFHTLWKEIHQEHLFCLSMMVMGLTRQQRCAHLLKSTILSSSASHLTLPIEPSLWMLVFWATTTTLDGAV
jgi:hypothetical protein